VPALILKLADLMRHIIYESKDNYIALEKELEFVQNFIDLQKIRTSESNLIQFEIFGNPPVAKIAPLIFEPFIDNAFKYGLPGSENSDFIKIRFDFTTENMLKFEIANNFQELFLKKPTNSGIGLNNVKQRLKLLYAKNEYSLSINTDSHIFHVKLELKLK
jgi:two-component system, LytTR family, sensor kinase